MVTVRVVLAAVLGLVMMVGAAAAGSAQGAGAAAESPAPGAATARADPSGNYRVQGTGPDDASYVGQATVARQGDLYLVRWQVGDDSYQGTGLVQGTAFGVVWTAEDGSSPGIALYTIAPGGGLSGVWATHGQPGVGTEVWTPAGG